MYIKNISIENIKCFGNKKNAVNIDLQRPDGSYAGFTVLAGRNGTGKSTFLRAVALSIAGMRMDNVLMESNNGWIRSGENEAEVSTIIIPDKKLDKFYTEANPKEESYKLGLRWESSKQYSSSPVYPQKESIIMEEILEGPWSLYPKGWFIAGYGPSRYLPTYTPDLPRGPKRFSRLTQLESLFNMIHSLSDAISWLKEIYLFRLENRPGYREIEDGVLSLLNDGLLPDGMKILRFDADGLWVAFNGIEQLLGDLSDGYRTVAALIVDLARQLYDSYGEFKVINHDGKVTVPYPGVVLIDELDAHMHVTWQQQIGFWLKEHFPAIQFIVTTHSPFICQAADPKGVIRLPAPGEDRAVEHVSEELYNTIVNGSIDESVLTELFGLETLYSKVSEGIQDELARLEVLIKRGKATQKNKSDYKKLADKLPKSQSQAVNQAMRFLQKITCENSNEKI